MSFRDKARQYIGWGITALFVLCGAILFYCLINNIPGLFKAIGKFFSIISPVIIGMVIAYLLAPLINIIERRVYKNKEYTKKGKKRVRYLTVILVELLFLIALIGCLRLIIPQLVTSINNITENYDKYYDNTLKALKKLEKKYPDISVQIENFINNDSEKINEYLDTKLLPMANEWIVNITNGIFSTVKFVFNFAIGIMISVYLLFSKEKFAAQAKKILYAFMSREKANAFIHNLRFADKTFNGFIVGKIIDSVIIGFICYFCLLILGTPYSVLISVIIGVTNIIPFFGPFIGAIPCALLLILINPMQCLYFVIMIILLQQFDGNVLGPKILGSTTGITGFWVIFAITLFGGLWGPIGMIVGVPLFAIIYTTISAAIKTKLEARGLDPNTDLYKYANYIDEDGKFMNIPKSSVITVTSRKRMKAQVVDKIEYNELRPKKAFFKKKKKQDNNSSENKEK